MPKCKFGDLVYNITEKASPIPGDEELYIGLEHLDSGSLKVSRWGSKVVLTGDKLKMQKGDILFGRRNTYLRRVAIAPHDGLFSAHGMIFRAKTERMDEEYLPFFIASDYFMDEAIRISVGSLSPTVNWKELKELEFNVPELETQRENVKTLLAANELKEKYEELLAKTDDLVKSQFIEMFGDPMRNEKNWPTLTLKEASIRLSDGPFGSNLKSEHYALSGVRVIRLQNICAGYFLDDDKAYVSYEHYEKIKKYTCRAGDVIIGTLGEPNLRACIIPEYIDFAINKADCVHFVPKPDLLNKRFVCEFLNCPRTLEMASDGVHGNTRQRISSGHLAKMNIYIPAMDIQVAFEQICKQTDKSKLVVYHRYKLCKLFTMNYIFGRKNGGSWKITDPKAEIQAINDMNKSCNYNLKRLCKMARAWKAKNNVDISGILIDILAYKFLSTWEYKDKSYYYYDWMCRDFFEYLSKEPTSQTKWQAMGSGRYIYCFGSFQTKAKTAFEDCKTAISYEKQYPTSANNKWRDIFGSKFPITI